MLATRELFSRSCEPEFDVLDSPGLQASATGIFDDARPGVHRHFGKHADRVTEGTCPSEFRFRFRMHGPAPGGEEVLTIDRHHNAAPDASLSLECLYRPQVK